MADQATVSDCSALFTLSKNVCLMEKTQQFHGHYSKKFQSVTIKNEKGRKRGKNGTAGNCINPTVDRA